MNLHHVSVASQGPARIASRSLKRKTPPRNSGRAFAGSGEDYWRVSPPFALGSVICTLIQSADPVALLLPSGSSYLTSPKSPFWRSANAPFWVGRRSLL